MTTTNLPSPALPLVVRGETILRSLLFLMLAIGSVSFFEPSPYEIVFLALLPTVLLGHLVITRVTLAFFFIVGIFLAAEMLSLMPYLADRPAPAEDGVGATATVYTLQTLYLFGSAIMFAIVFTRNTKPRLRLALTAYTISSVFAAAWAAAGYFSLPGFHDTALIVNRIAGPFKDPNVLGSYSVLGVLCLMQTVVVSSSRGRRLLSIFALAFTIFGGVFLPLSRGAWGAMVFATAYFGVVTYYTADDRKVRRNLVSAAVVMAVLVAAAAAFVMSDSTLREIVSDRAKIEQDYDGGATGRFGNQIRSIPMLIERPLGFGPHRFAFYFDLDPHNSFIGAFASAGWIGGIFFLLLIMVTSLIGIRLTLRRTPYLREAQVVVPALTSAFLQALQIDIDHWRFIYFMIGAVWGMEAARVLALDQAGKVIRHPRIVDTVGRPTSALS